MANLQSYGFWKHADLAAERISVVGVETIINDVLESVEVNQREMDNALTNFVDVVTWFKKKYWLASGGTLQPLDEHGNPLPRIPTGNYDIALPIRGGGDAWGDDRITRAKMTVQDADRFTAMVTAADIDWNMRHLLAAWFTNVTYTYVDKEHGSLVVQPLANGDTVTYTRRNGTVSTDNHFLGQANAIDNSNNPFPTIYRELYEHPSNDGPYIAYIAGNLETTVTALSSFREVGDPDIELGADSDRLVGSFDPGVGEVIGKANKVWIATWDRLPDSYIVAHAAGAAGKPFAAREYEEDELRGLFPEFQNIDGNRQLNKFIRYRGYGSQNRVAALAMEIADASYDIPASFQAPLAI